MTAAISEVAAEPPTEDEGYIQVVVKRKPKFQLDLIPKDRSQNRDLIDLVLKLAKGDILQLRPRQPPSLLVWRRRISAMLRYHLKKDSRNFSVEIFDKAIRVDKRK